MDPADGSERPVRRPGALRVGFLGRWDPVKGIHVLVEAFRRLPSDIETQLYVHALPGDAAYEKQLRSAAQKDRRITIGDPVERGRVLQVLRDFDVLAVPSLGLETGPLVVLEAIAAGVPVLGSNLGGIAELLDGAPSSRLLPPGDVTAWSRAVAALGTEAWLRSSGESAGLRRSFDDVAKEVAGVYGRLLNGRSAAH
jgi:glycosyltransferase involved in cell wall biosynthesis